MSYVIARVQRRTRCATGWRKSCNSLISVYRMPPINCVTGWDCKHIPFAGCLRSDTELGAPGGESVTSPGFVPPPPVSPAPAQQTARPQYIEWCGWVGGELVDRPDRRREHWRSSCLG